MWAGNIKEAPKNLIAVESNCFSALTYSWEDMNWVDYICVQNAPRYWPSIDQYQLQYQRIHASGSTWQRRDFLSVLNSRQASVTETFLGKASKTRFPGFANFLSMFLIHAVLFCAVRIKRLNTVSLFWTSCFCSSWKSTGILKSIFSAQNIFCSSLRGYRS